MVGFDPVQEIVDVFEAVGLGEGVAVVVLQAVAANVDVGAIGGVVGDADGP